MDGIQDWAALVGILVVLAGAVGYLLNIQIQNGINTSVDAAKKEADASIAVVKDEANKTNKAMTDDLYNFKLECTKTYASLLYMGSVEKRLVDEMHAVESRMTTRMDSVDHKLERLLSNGHAKKRGGGG